MTGALLSGCGGLPSGGTPSSSAPAGGALHLRVEITSDVDTAAELSVDIDANEPQQLEKTNASLPFDTQFDVPTNTPFPLRGFSVEATAAPGSEWIECRVTLDGQVAAEDRATGPGATATCSKQLRLGPQ